MNAYPLSWPNGWPRTRSRKSARFTRKERHYGQGGGSWTSSKSLTISDGVQRCLSELDKLGVRDGDAVISTNARKLFPGAPVDDEVLLNALHKARYECKDLPTEARHESANWLRSRGYGRMAGLPLLPPGELPE